MMFKSYVRAMALLAILTPCLPAMAGLNISDIPTFVTAVLPPNVIISPIFRFNANEVSMLDVPWDTLRKCQAGDVNVCYSDATGESPQNLLTRQTWTAGSPFNYGSQLWRVTPWPGTTNVDSYLKSVVYSPIEVYSGDRINIPGVYEELSPLRYVHFGFNNSSTNFAREEIYPEAGNPYVGDFNKGKLAYLRSNKNFLYFNKTLADQDVDGDGSADGYSPWPSLGDYVFGRYPTAAAAATPYYNPLRKTQSGVDIKANLASIEPGWVYSTINDGSSVMLNANHMIGQYYLHKGQGNEVWRSTSYDKYTWNGDPGSTAMTADDKIHFAHWFTYWRSSDLAMRGLLGNLVSTLKNRDLLDRFRIGINYFDSAGQSRVNVMAAVGDTKSEKIANLENRLANIIYDYNKTLGGYNQNRVVDYYKTMAAYRDDPTDTSAGVTGARSCRRNYEIIVTPDYSGLFFDAGASNAINSPSPGDADGDGVSSLWGDVGAYAYNNDLVTDLADTLLPGARDQATHQHLVRFVVGPKAEGTWFGSNIKTFEAADQLFNTKTAADWRALATSVSLPDSTVPASESMSDARHLARQFTIDDLWHMTLNSGGFFYNSDNINSAVANMLDAFNEILVNNTTGAAIATNTTSLALGGLIFQATVENNWRGHLKAYQVTRETITINGKEQSVLSLDYGVPVWDLAETLSSLVENPALRTVITLNQNTNQGAAFTWGAIGSRLQNVFMDALPQVLPTVTIPDAEKPTVAEKMLNYLRGDKSCEDGATPGCKLLDGTTQYTFLRRSTVRGNLAPFAFNRSVEVNVDNGNSGGRNALGDIANSSPWYVGQPPSGISDVDYPGFNRFRVGSDVLARPDVLYVGSNDGMLHAVKVSDGSELFAYVPSFVQDNLPLLAATSYTHKFYVDGSPMSADVDMIGDGTGWKTVLAGGGNKGGKGYYLLDVTNPAEVTQANAAGPVLWEFTNTNIGIGDRNDLHYTYNMSVAQPEGALRAGQARQITRMNNGKWALIVGNGYSEDAGQRACLFVIYLSGPGVSGWTRDTNYKKICAGASDYSSISEKGLDTNGLSTPTPHDLNGDGKVDVVYAGDLNGNVWRFDVGDSDDSYWKVGLQGTPSDCTTSPASCKPLFVSRDSSGNRQPIVIPPEATAHSSAQSSGEVVNGVLLLWGTGKLIENADRASTVPQQSFYAVWDRDTPSDHTYLANDLTRSILSEKTFAQTSQNVGTVADPNNVVIRQQATPTSITYCTSASTADCESTVMGWFWDMPDAGERLTGRVSLINGIVLFNTYVPATDGTGALDPCAYGGTGWIMGLDAVYGNMATFPVFDLNRDGVIDTADTYLAAGARVGAAIGGTSFTRGIGDTNFGVYAPTDLGAAKTEGKKMSIIINTASKNSGRVSWFELLD